MPEGVWKIFVSLGVPGLALGVFYALFRVFSWDLSALSPITQVGLVILFMLIVAFITLMALRMWRPSSQIRSRSSVRIGSGSTIRGGVAGRDFKQGLINSESSETAISSSQSSVKIDRSASIAGSVAGRDILVNNDRLPDRAEELARILEDRATRIKAELAQHFHYTPVQDFLNRFEQLHIHHVDALRQGHLVRAHEILNEIHELSKKLQSDESWAERNHKYPGLEVKYHPEAFQRGYLIQWYAGSEAMERLVQEERMRTRYPEDNQKTSNPQKNASEVYTMIFDSKS